MIYHCVNIFNHNIPYFSHRNLGVRGWRPWGHQLSLTLLPLTPKFTHSSYLSLNFLSSKQSSGEPILHLNSILMSLTFFLRSSNKTNVKRHIERPRRSWKDNIKQDLEEQDCKDLIGRFSSGMYRHFFSSSNESQVPVSQLTNYIPV